MQRSAPSPTYFKLNETGADYAGLGARAGFNIMSHVQIEAEMNYDFNQVFTERFKNPTTGVITVQNSNLRILHGLFGPKIQTKGPVRVFVTAKGGFVNFRFDSRPASFTTFASSVDNLRTNDVSATFYPGGGVEAFFGPIGIRAEVGDEMIFTDRVRHNWRVTFGPQIRF
jgi:hypothetical protein